MTAGMRAGRWALALGWMALVLALSTKTFSFDNTLGVVEAVAVRVMAADAATAAERINARARTGAHVLVYGVLAILLARALAVDRRPARRAVAITLAVCVAWAMLDESHQAREPARRGKVTDVALDLAGGVLGIAAWLARPRRDPARRAQDRHRREW